MQATVNDSGKTKTAERTQFAIKNMFTSEFDAVSVGQNYFFQIHTQTINVRNALTSNF